MTIEFWVASHLTGLFEINDQSTNLLEIGSRGAGISIERGVKTTISESTSPTVKVKFNGILQQASNTLITNRAIDVILPEEEKSIKSD